MKNFNFKTLPLLGLMFVALAIGMVSCDKENETFANQPTLTTDNLTPSTKDVAKDSIRVTGRIGGMNVDVVIVINDDCTFTIEGDVEINGNTFHISGEGTIKSRGFKGTITDGKGNNIDITNEWIERIYSIVDRALLMSNILPNIVDTLSVN